MQVQNSHFICIISAKLHIFEIKHVNTPQLVFGQIEDVPICLILLFHTVDLIFQLTNVCTKLNISSTFTITCAFAFGDTTFHKSSQH